MKIGLIRLAVLRSTPVFALVNIAMVAYLFIESAGWAHWYFAVTAGLLLWVWIDMKFIWKSEINETFGQSKDIAELLRLGRNIQNIASGIYLEIERNMEVVGLTQDVEDLKKLVETAHAEWDYEQGLRDGRAGHD